MEDEKTETVEPEQAIVLEHLVSRVTLLRQGKDSWRMHVETDRTSTGQSCSSVDILLTTTEALGVQDALGNLFHQVAMHVSQWCANQQRNYEIQ